MSKVEYPLVEPIYSTLNSQAYATAIFKNNESIKNWCYNDSTMLKCTKRFLSDFSSPELYVVNSSWIECPYIDKQWYGLRFVDGYINYVIRQMIDEGYYVYFFGIDDYYLDGKSWYNKRHFSHDGLIYGYDTDLKTYLVYAYDINWVLTKLSIPVKSFEKGRKSEIKDGVYGYICGLKPMKDEIKFNCRRSIKNISKYLESSFDKYPVLKDGTVQGIAVLNYLSLYVDKLADGSILYEKIDNRVFRMVWEHKKTMHERIKKIEQTLRMGNELSAEYLQIVNDANTIRMLYASHCLKRRDSVLPVISSKVISMKDKEASLLAKLIAYVKKGG